MYERVSKEIDAINDLLWDKLTDKEMRVVMMHEAEILRSISAETLYADGEEVRTIVDEVFEPWKEFEEAIERMIGK